MSRLGKARGPQNLPTGARCGASRRIARARVDPAAHSSALFCRLERSRAKLGSTNGLPHELG